MRAKQVWAVLGLVAGTAAGVAAARMSSPTGHVIARDAVAGGAGRSTAPTGHVLQATLGQPVVGISTAATGHILIHGFHTWKKTGPTYVQHWELY